MQSSVEVSALILAGGKATRLGGIAKHLLVVDGQTIFARQVAVLAPLVAEIIVSSPEDIAGHRTVRDAPAHAGAGPLAGIAAGLVACRTPWLLVVAGDMPHLTAEVVERLLAGRLADVAPAAGPRTAAICDTANATACDAVGLRANGLPEPLLSLLHVRVLPIVMQRIAAGRFKASGLLTDEGLAVRWIDDADPRALRNVNSPEDL